MWFDHLGQAPETGRNELHAFMAAVRNFLHDVLRDRENFGFLWNLDPELERLAQETFETDIQQGFGEMEKGIYEAQDRRLHGHGLLGRPLRFKLRVVAALGRRWERVRGQFSARAWFKRMVDAIDALLDSLIEAVGAGGVIKEFKDALAALVPES